MANAETAEPPAKGGSMGLVLITAVLCLALGGGGAFFFLSKDEPAAAEATQETGAEGAEGAEGGEGAEGAQSAEDASEEFRERLLSLDPMIINITGDGYARLLKVRVELECESAEVREEAEARIPQIRDGILTLVSSKRLTEVTAFEGKALLKEELQHRFNQMLTTGRVESVLLTEFVVQ